MTNNSQPESSPQFKDRKTGLVIFGIIELLIGGLIALMVPLMVLSMVMISKMELESSTTYTFSGGMMVGICMFYALLAAFFFTTGIGSIKARRWARAIMLVVSWIWLIFGALSFLFWIIMMPEIGQYMAASQESMGQTPMPQNALNFFGYFIGAFLFLIYVILPGAFVLFYQSKHVKATCEWRDPEPRWTDRCPLPVLAVSFMWLFSAIGIISYISFGGVFPMFGILLTGTPAIVMILAAVAVFGLLAYGLYFLDPRAWWGSLVFSVLGLVSWLMTISSVGIYEIYMAMGFQEEQAAIMAQYLLSSTSIFTWWCVIGGVLWLVYLFWLKRYFIMSPSSKLPESV